MMTTNNQLRKSAPTRSASLSHLLLRDFVRDSREIPPVVLLARKNISTILEQELEQRVVIRENGKQKSVTKRRASMKQFVNKAIAGDPQALQLLINYLRELELNPPNRLSPAYDDAKFEMMAARLDDNEQMTFLKLMNKARGGPEMTG
jgi:hypothetical protein